MFRHYRTVVITGTLLLALVGCIVENSNKAYVQISLPDDCSVVRPTVDSHGTGWCILYLSPGKRTVRLNCAGKLYDANVDVNEAEMYIGLDKKRMYPLDKPKD